MQIIHNLTMELTRREEPLMLDAVQGDGNTRTLQLKLLENGQPWEVPSGVTAAVAFRKPDKRKGLYDTLPDGTRAVTFDGSTVTAVLAPQVLSCPGETAAAVVFYDAGLNQLATFPFTIRVEKNPAAGQEISNDYYRFSTMEAVSEAVEAALHTLETAQRDFLQKAEEALAVVHDTAAEDAPAIVCENTGEMITVSDSSDRPLKGLTLWGKTLQNGTPTPENPVPLVSVGEGGAIRTTVCGKNLFRQSDQYWITANPDGTYKIGSTESESAGLTENMTGKLPAGTYTISYPQGYGLMFVMRSADDYTQQVAVGAARTFSYDGKSYLRIITNNIPAGKTATYKVQLERGTTATEWEPYKGQTLTASTPGGLPGIPVESGGNYTDENGQQWICDEIDFAKGVYVQRVAKLRLPIADMNNTESYPGWTNSGIKNYVPYNTNTSLKGAGCSAICNVLGDTGNTVNANTKDGNDILCLIGTLKQSQWKAQCHDLVFELLISVSKPMETALSAGELAAYAALHSNKPITTVSNGSGAGMKLSYVADTKTYIDNKFAAISAAILS